MIGQIPGGERNPEAKPLIWAGLGFATGHSFRLDRRGRRHRGGAHTLHGVPLHDASRGWHIARDDHLHELRRHPWLHFQRTFSAENLPPYSIGYLNHPIWACLAVISIPVAQLGA
jgi:hypothetical protein